MKKSLLVSAVAAALLSSPAFAQVQNFGGFSVGVNMDLTGTHTESTIGTLAINSVGQPSVGGSVQAAFGYAATDLVLLSVGATYSLNEIPALSLASTTGSSKLKLKDAYSVYVEPAYLISDKTLAYGKIGYEAGTMNTEATGLAASKKDINGAAIGLGLRTLISKNLYLQAEARRVAYNSARFDNDITDFKSSITVGSVGLGYKF
jgi:opacity protein-like surface antigen